jgi:uncharacterized protein Yka (UPF0111/DUF47 family)
MKNILTRFLPDNDKVFFNLFNRASANSAAMAKLLFEAVSGEWIPDQKTEFAQISRLKANSSDIKRQVYAVSGKALVSPFERNDMYALVSAINSVSDYIDSSARRINLYSIDVITPSIHELCRIIMQATIELEKCVLALNDIENPDVISDLCNVVKQLEHDADDVYDEAFAQLNAEETDTFQLIKYSEILGALERTTDKCESVTYIIESILIKNS